MSASPRMKNSHGTGVDDIVSSDPKVRHVVACVDTSPLSRKVIPHALAVAEALGGDLTLIRVLESATRDNVPPDPVEWDIRRMEARHHVETLAREHASGKAAIEAHVLEGNSAEQICMCVHDIGADLTALCTKGEGEAKDWVLGNTARRVIEAVNGSILLVPSAVPDTPEINYRRVLVPLDGSSRAESALPAALSIAGAQNAELVLVHAVPEPELTEIGPFEVEDQELRELLIRRNERVAQDYLDRIRVRVANRGINVRTLMVRGGDARHLLAEAVSGEEADIIVLASHGRSGHEDVPAGAVATYLIAHCDIPLLIIREQASGAERHAGKPTHLRLPDQATP